MEKVVEFTGKKVQDAVDEGLKALGLTLDDADIKIISNGGLFKKAKVAIRYEAKDEEVAPVKEEKVAPVRQEKQADEIKREPKQSDAKHKEEKKPNKQTTPPEGEPHWGTAPVKREPSTTSNFGKSVERNEKKEKSPEPEKSEAPAKKAEQKERAPKKARESANPTEEQIGIAKAFLSGLLAEMNIEGNVEIAVNEGMRININTEDSRVIGHRGEVLDSMQQLVSSLINTSHTEYVHVSVDGLGYRGRRKESLEGLAQRMADKAVRTHHKVTLDAMNSGDRRVIHAALGNRDDVFTRSEGHEPARRVAIIPKRKQ